MKTRTVWFLLGFLVAGISALSPFIWLYKKYDEASGTGQVVIINSYRKYLCAQNKYSRMWSWTIHYDGSPYCADHGELWANNKTDAWLKLGDLLRNWEFKEGMRK